MRSLTGSTATARRRLMAALTATGLGGATAVVLLSAPSAVGAPDPCAASEMARTISNVARSAGDYLDGHPETNQAMTSVMQQPAGPQSVDLAERPTSTPTPRQPAICRPSRRRSPDCPAGARCRDQPSAGARLHAVRAGWRCRAVVPGGTAGGVSPAAQGAVPQAARPQCAGAVAAMSGVALIGRSSCNGRHRRRSSGRRQWAACLGSASVDRRDRCPSRCGT